MGKSKQHPVHYLCNVHDAITDIKRSVFIGERTTYTDIEVMNILNEISEILLNQEVEALNDYEQI